MSGINKAIILGRLGADPDVRRTNSGDAVATLSIATSEEWKDKATGEKVKKTEWHRVVFWRRLAEIAEQYLHKGDQVYIEGQIETRKWQDNTGQDRYTTEIRAQNMQMLGSPASRDQPQRQSGPSPYAQPQQGAAPGSARSNYAPF